MSVGERLNALIPRLAAAGLNYHQITSRLERGGAARFVASYERAPEAMGARVRTAEVPA
jgi:hypothetical protein